MFLHSIKSTLFATINVIFLFILTSCSSSSNTSDKIPSKNDIIQTEQIKYGVVKNGCGPTDAPVVRIILTDEDFSCTDSHENIKHINSYIEIGSVEQIKVGMSLLGHYSASQCEKNFQNCIDLGELSLDILADHDNELEGIWRIKKSDRIEKFRVHKCKTARSRCG